MPTGVLLRLYIVFFWGFWLLLVLGFCFFELAAQEVHHLGAACFGVGEAVLRSVGAAAAEEDAEGVGSSRCLRAWAWSSARVMDSKFGVVIGRWGKGLRLYFGIGDFLWGRGFGMGAIASLHNRLSQQTTWQNWREFAARRKSGQRRPDYSVKLDRVISKLLGLRRFDLVDLKVLTDICKF
jgi:hypothetical protein